MRFDWSWRYAVVGVYIDRGRKLIRLYPVPFFRVSIGPR
jgi:hypothetical protein